MGVILSSSRGLVNKKKGAGGGGGGKGRWDDFTCLSQQQKSIICTCI